MTYYEVNAELIFGIRFKIGGVLVHSVDLKYMEADGHTPTAQNINFTPYVAVIQHGGHTIQIRVDGSLDTPQGFVLARKYTISADSRFFVAYTTQLNQVAYYPNPNPGYYDYDIAYDLRTSPRHLSVGNTSSSVDLTASLSDLWNTCTIPNHYGFGGIVTADINWWNPTYLPLRNTSTGVLLRDTTSGKILIDC